MFRFNELAVPPGPKIRISGPNPQFQKQRGVYLCMTHAIHRPRPRLEPDVQLINPPVFLTAREAAALLRLSEITLSRWRIEGSGPPFLKFGRRVLYDHMELLAWAKLQTRGSTSEHGNQRHEAQS
jgi:hypothetical protein